MKLFLISQSVNNDYDTYDSAVVAAPDEETARNMNPSTGDPVNWGDQRMLRFRWFWAPTPEQVAVRFLGLAVSGVEQGVVCASFNAG